MADTSQITTYKCPNCSAGLPFNGGEGLMVCEYCGSEFDPEALRQAGEIFGAEQAEPEWNESQNEEWTDESKGLFRCDSCGAVTVADAVTAASFCPYCGNPAVLSSRLSGELRPDLVIPFCVEREAAEKALAAFTDTVADTLKKGDKIQLVGFGTFEVRERAARTGINPQTKQTIKIAASKNPVFKAGKALKDTVAK